MQDLHIPSLVQIREKERKQAAKAREATLAQEAKLAAESEVQQAAADAAAMSDKCGIDFFARH